MLTNIESKLEELLAATDLMPADYAEQMEKSREKVRPAPPALLTHGAHQQGLCTRFFVGFFQRVFCQP
jgi:hypothetical protein